MAKVRSNQPGLRSRLVNQGKKALLSRTELVKQTQSLSGVGKASTTGSSASELNPLSFSARQTPESIKFGSPSNSGTGTTASQSGREWGRLLKQTASGGLTSAFGLGSIGGLGSTVSSIMSLFGSHKGTPPPLVRFELPASQQRTLVIDSGTRGSNQSNAGQSATPVASVSALNGSPSLEQQQAQVIQAVKKALLNSSSLNDVISEI